MPETRQLSIIKKPAPGDGRTVFELTNPDAGLAGSGDIDFVCGGCRSVLISGAAPGQFRDLVLRCFKCRCYNATLD